MTVYVLNTLIVPVDFDRTKSVTVNMVKIDAKEASEIFKRCGFASAVGHEGTARVMSSLFGVEIPVCRVSVFLRKGDMAIHFFMKERLPEGKVLSEEEIKKLPFWLVLSEVV